MTLSSASVYFTWLCCLMGIEIPGSGGAACAAHQCKAVPGTPAWPSAAAWAKLNASTGGRLLHPSPPAAVCHSHQPTYNESECSAVQSEWSLFPFHDDNPVSVGSNEFTLDSCLPEASSPCSSEGYPVYVINATTAEHAKLGVDFGEPSHKYSAICSCKLFAGATKLTDTRLSSGKQRATRGQVFRTRLHWALRGAIFSINLDSLHGRHRIQQ
jgi:hypothetical protein